MMADDGYSEDLLYFNGVNATTGEYSLPPMTSQELSSVITGEMPPENIEDLRHRYRLDSEGTFGVRANVDVRNLAETGWGVIFPYGVDPAIKEALRPLLDWRQEAAAQEEERYFQVYDGHRAFRPAKEGKPAESTREFLARHKIDGSQPADPDKMPYYLLIVGGPQEIPFEFQYQLDVQYAVGRVHFETPQEYANYAQSVVEAEGGAVKLPRRVSFFGTAGDRATEMSAEYLVKGLFEKLNKERPGWGMDAFLEAEATKAQLGDLLGGDSTPALLFTASHGVDFDLGDPRQIPHQGALLCQDWPGEGRGSILEEHYFAGQDVTDDAGLLGLMAFHFACFGAGTPLMDAFSKREKTERRAIAPHPFLARLPMRLLGHPRGGALAVVGHVDRVWSDSFFPYYAGIQTGAFESTLISLLDGHRVGFALEYFNERYAYLATQLSQELEEIDYGKQVDPRVLAATWGENNDARSYAIIGDPAVRLPVAEPDETPGERPAIEVKPVAAADPAAPQEAAPEAATHSTTPAEAELGYSLSETGAELRGKRVAILAENLYQELELWYPLLRMREAGAKVQVVGTGSADTYASKHGYEVTVDVEAGQVSAAEFDAVIIPGGYAPDLMRRYPDMVKLVREAFEGGKVVAAICHAGWMLVSADVLKGKRATCLFAIKDDLVNAGATYLDQEVVVDGNLITSRRPDDLPAFCRAIIAALRG
jgi:PfpI family intracellular protease